MKTAKHLYNDFNELPAILQAEHVIRLTGLSRAKVYADLFRRPDFPVISIGRRKIVPKQRFLQWLDSQTGNGE